MMWKLLRLADGPDGTIGILESPHGQTFHVLEEEDRDNRSNISRIPAGTYTCVRGRFHAGGYDTFEVKEVQGRSLIKFHRGNTEEDSAGCLLIGNSLGVLTVRDEDTGALRRKLAVTQSAAAFERFMELLRGVQSFALRIYDPGDALAA